MVLSEDEMVPDPDDVGETKDFRYYAEKAEQQIQLSLGHEADGTQLFNSDGAKTRHVMRAQVYATLAAGAPEPAPQRIELHDAACPCIKR